MTTAGFGPQHFVRGDSTLPYRINFENLGPASTDPTTDQHYATYATAPAQRVTISDQLADNLDWSTFRLGELGFGDTVVTIPSGSQHYETTVSITYNGRAFDVELAAGIDLATGLVFATFQSVDPTTGLPPDVLAGFLLPEDGTGRGKGYFSFTVRPRAGLPTGTEIRNVALISFDGQTIIATDQIDPFDPAKGVDPDRQALTTIDAAAPASGVTALPASSPGHVLVTWAGADDVGGSGVGGYDVYVSDDGGPFTLWLGNTTQSKGAYVGQQGHTYAFYSVARDNVGNEEAPPAAPDATTTVTDATPPKVTLAQYDEGSPLPVGPVKHLVVRFAEDVQESLKLADVKVHNLTTGQDLTPTSLTYDPATNAALIELGSAIIPDGNYVLTIGSSGVWDAIGNAFDGDGDGQPGGDFTFAFFELAGDLNRDRKVDDADRQQLVAALGTSGVRPQDGDANGDRVVNFPDLLALAKNYGKTGTTVAQGDFNSDGKTDFTDLLILAKHYNQGGRGDLNRDGTIDQADLALLDANLGKTLPPPPPSGTPVFMPPPKPVEALPAGFEQLFRSLTSTAATPPTLVTPPAPPKPATPGRKPVVAAKAFAAPRPLAVTPSKPAEPTATPPTAGVAAHYRIPATPPTAARTPRALADTKTGAQKVAAAAAPARLPLFSDKRIAASERFTELIS